MAWASMHFAAGMAGGAVISGIASLVVRRGWRFMPVAMTLGGLWAILPDLPRLFRVDFPWLGLASTLDSEDLEYQLHSVGNLFFLHRSLDAQPRELALHGLIAMILLYNAAIILLLFLEWRQRHSIAQRAWRAHRAQRRSSQSTPVHDPPEASQDPQDPVIGRIGENRAS